MLIRYCQSSNFKHHAGALLRWQGLASSRPRPRLLRGQVVTSVMSRGHMAPGGTGVSSVGGADTIQGEHLKVRTCTVFIHAWNENTTVKHFRTPSR